MSSTASEFKALIAHITHEVVEHSGVYKNFPSAIGRLQSAIAIITLNLLRVRFSDPTRHLAFPRSQEAYRMGGGATRVGQQLMMRAFDAFVKLHYMTIEAAGVYDRESKKGFVTRVACTKKFMAICTEHGIRSSMISPIRRHALVELRDTKENGKRLLSWPKAPEAKAERKRMEDNLRHINAALANAFIGLHVTDATLRRINSELRRRKEESSFVDFFNKQLYRVFHDGSTDLGGRFYGGWWQGVPRQYRKNIHIGHKGAESPRYCAEADYSGHQPRILYARAKKKAPDDIYRIYDDRTTNTAARPLVKIALLVMLNADSRSRALWAIRDQVQEAYEEPWYLEHGDKGRPPAMRIEDMLPKGCPPIEKVMDDVKERHGAIADYFYTDVGKSLMYVDARIAERVLLRLLDQHDVVALPIHDSFLVHRKFGNLLKEVMEEEAQAETGHLMPVKLQQLEFEDTRSARRHLGQYLTGPVPEHRRKDSLVYRTLLEDWVANHPTTSTRQLPLEPLIFPIPMRRIRTSAQ
jgi:hypothetical protein